MDSSVGFLLENLKQLVSYHADLIGNAEHELKLLNDELGEFKAILEDASRRYKKDELFQKWEGQIREAVYDIEDTIDTCVTEASAGKAGKRNWYNKVFSSKRIVLAEEVRILRDKTVKPLMSKFQLAKFSVADAPDTVVDDARKRRLKKTSHIVGLEPEAQSFVNLLTGESDELKVSSIIGMAGLGKTTFAWKIFENSIIKFEFPLLIWVNVSEKLNVRKVLLDILLKFTANKPDESVTDEELTTTVKGLLQDGKFLIVMDDIWTIDAWKKLRDLLPTDNKWGRVLITTRHTDVGNNASSQLAYNLRFLTAKESWELLRYEVFGKLEDVPQELDGVGKDIVTDCKGLPLSIVVIGGILEEKTSRSGDNITAIKKEWEEVSMSVRSYLVEGDAKKLLGSIISLSYDKLPYELRNCFLYLGVFPEDADIPVKKLIRLWIAEGFIQECRGKRLEEVAHNNLKELINRNLVMVRLAKPGGEAKICHIHDSIREICKREGAYGKLNLFQEISKSEPRESIAKYRRLCIHSHAIDFFSRKTKLPKARSFLCFNESPMTLEPKEMAYVTDNFGLLRVYDAKDIKFPKFPPKFVQQLNHLRYLTLAVADVSFKILPEIVTDLWNLQTLIVETPSPTLEVKGDIWKMRQLRHFKTRASIMFRKVGEGECSDKLQTLSRLSPESCTDEVCKKATSLLTLVIQGDVRILGESKRLGDLDSLNKLKLVHQVSRGGAADNPCKRIPDSHGFPPKLKILVLHGTHLDWTKMSIFSAIVSLEVLKLKENAFQGNNWEVVGSGFIHLVCLHIERADFKRWTANNDHFPELKFLYINNCERLSEIPSTLGKKLEVLTLERVTDDAVICAKEIEEEQKKLGRVIRLDIAAADRNRQLS